MAGRSLLKPNSRLFADDLIRPSAATTTAATAAEEYDESDIWGVSMDADPLNDAERKPMPYSRSRRIPQGRNTGEHRAVAATLPVNIPDWGKILGEGYDRRGSTEYGSDDDEDEGEEGGIGVVPPHEYLWRRRRAAAAASFSVHEGLGRTLKGRDLSRVRNAVWEKTGFED